MTWNKIDTQNWYFPPFASAFHYSLQFDKDKVNAFSIFCQESDKQQTK